MNWRNLIGLLILIGCAIGIFFNLVYIRGYGEVRIYEVNPYILTAEQIIVFLGIVSGVVIIIGWIKK